MELVKNVEVLFYEKVKRTVNIEIHSRGGTDSPTLEIIVYKGKRYPPIAQRFLKIRYTLNTLFKLTYGDKIESMIWTDNSFLSMVPKDNSSGSLWYQPVILKM